MDHAVHTGSDTAEQEHASVTLKRTLSGLHPSGSPFSFSNIVHAVAMESAASVIQENDKLEQTYSPLICSAFDFFILFHSNAINVSLRLG